MNSGTLLLLLLLSLTAAGILVHAVLPSSVSVRYYTLKYYYLFLRLLGSYKASNDASTIKLVVDDFNSRRNRD